MIRLRRGTVALIWALATPAGAAGLFERNHPDVARGMEAYEAGRFEDALQAFDAAKRDRPNDPAVELDRGNALHRLGRLEEARLAFERAQQLGQGELSAKAHYNLGNSWAALDDLQRAAASYRRALALDPKDADARHNLEVVQRKLKKPDQPSGSDGGQDAGPPDSSPDGGKSDAGQPDAGPPDGGQDGGPGADGGSDGGQDGGADGGTVGAGDAGASDGGEGDAGGSDEGEQQGRDAGEEAAPMGTDGGQIETFDGGLGGLSKQQAERLLDAMKQNERNLQMWRFQKKRQRKPNEKDW